MLGPDLDPYGAYGIRQGGLPPLAPDDEESLLSKLGSKALGGIGYVGSVLEKLTGGRAVRGLLGGKPRELLSLIPGSDISGLTNEEDRVSGKELLGLKDEDGILPGAAGLAAEVALDPSTYLTFGGSALTKSGQLAKAAGLLPETVAGRAGTTLADLMATGANAGKIGNAAAAQGLNLADLAGERLGGLVGIGLPFQHPSAVLGASDAGVNAMNAIGNAANYVGHVSPVRKLWEPLQQNVLDPASRYAGAIFNAANKGFTDPLAQQGAQAATGLEKQFQVGSRGGIADLATQLDQAGLGSGRGADLRRVLEGVSSPVDPAVGRPLNEIADRVKADLAKRLGGLQTLGNNPGELVDQFAEYFPRHHDPLEGEVSGVGRPRQPFQTNDPGIGAREEILKNIPGGTEGIVGPNGEAIGGLNPMTVDPKISGPNASLNIGIGPGQRKLASADYIRKNYLQMDDADLARYHDLSNKDFGQMRQLAGKDPQLQAEVAALEQEHAALAAKVKQSEHLADWTANLHPAYAETGDPFFNNNPVKDLDEYFRRTDRIKAVAESVHDMVAQSAIPVAGQPGFVPQGHVSVADLLKNVGLDYQVANAHQGVFSTLADRIGNGVTAAQVQGMVVPDAVAEQITKFARGFSQPESTSPILAAYDWMTKATKAATTAPWLSHHVRNFLTGAWQNLVTGANEPGLDAINGFIKPIQDAYTLHSGGVIADANKIPMFANLTPEQATQEIGKLAYAHGVLQHGSFARDATEAAGHTLEDMLHQIPGQGERGLHEVTNKLFNPAGYDPRKTGLDYEQFAPIAAGRELGDTIEAGNSGSLFIAKLRQGYTPEAAAAEVRAAHFDYSPSSMSPTEKSVFKRVLPFYGFMKQNLPFQLEQLVQRPGGLVAQEAKLTASLREDQHGFLPDYLGGGLALPVPGGQQEGTQRFLTRLGLPAEEAFEPLQGGPNPISDTAMRLLGETNPLIKGPLEFATGKQFFSGRDLADLHSSLGALPAGRSIEQILMNSPASKALTVGRTLLDERKWQDPAAALALPVNLATGARLADVDMEKAQSIAARDYITQALRGNPEISHFESLAARPGAPLTAEEVALLRLNKTLEQQSQKAQQAQKQRIGILP